MVGQRVLVVDGLELELAPDGPTGFAGVILIKNKYYQARLWDKRLKKMVWLRGLHRTALEAARERAAAKQHLADHPEVRVAASPKKRTPRLASPLTYPSPPAPPHEASLSWQWRSRFIPMGRQHHRREFCKLSCSQPMEW